MGKAENWLENEFKRLLNDGLGNRYENLKKETPSKHLHIMTGDKVNELVIQENMSFQDVFSYFADALTGPVENRQKKLMFETKYDIDNLSKYDIDKLSQTCELAKFNVKTT